MVFRVIRYELKRSLPIYAVWAATAIMLAVIARLKVFSLSDMPLIYLMIFSSVGIMLYRYYQTMHGAEASFLFTINISSGKQLIVRYISLLIWSLFTVLLIGVVMLIQGEKMGLLIQSLSFTMKMLLLAEVTFSIFVLVIMICVPLTLSNIQPFSQRRILSFVILGAIIFGGFSLLTKTTERFIPAYLIVTNTGNIFIDSMLRKR